MNGREGDTKRISRRGFLRGALAGICLSALHLFYRQGEAAAASVSPLFSIKNIPAQPFYGGGNGNYHIGVDYLLHAMGDHGLKWYRSNQETDLSGPLGMIAPDDVVLIKVNAQWKYRGCTNSDLIRGLIQRILDHPDGFDGEVVIIENGQGRGSLNCDTTGGSYPDATVHANANDERHSFIYLVNTLFNDPRVSSYLLDPIRSTFIGSNNHLKDGYRVYEDVSYPCFTTAGGHRVELKKGIWNGTAYSQNLKLINVPVLKYHDTGGSELTASLKHFYGIVSMADGQSGFRHYSGLGTTCGKMIVSVRTPVLNIIDAIWVSHSSLAGYPAGTTFRANQILASQDPVALDYWAAKYILYPISGSPRHLPDFPGVDQWLTSARDMINGRGGLYNPRSSIFVDQVTKKEDEMGIFSFSGITLFTPNGGEAIPSGGRSIISWGAFPQAVTFKIMVSLNLGATWENVASDIPDSTYEWNVSIPRNNEPGCLIRVIGFDSNGKKVGSDRSDSPFTIEVVKVTSPEKGDLFKSEAKANLLWATNSTQSSVANVKLFYTLNGGQTWHLIITQNGNPGNYEWTLPHVSTAKKQCKVKVILKDGDGNTVGSDASNGYFTIEP